MTGITLTLAGRRVTRWPAIWVLANDGPRLFVSVCYLRV